MPVLNETTDAANGTSTSYSMDVGDYFFGSLGAISDSDWIEVTLQAGQTYTFGLVGVGALSDNLADPYLRLRDSAGSQIGFDDDDGPGRNSNLTFTATTTGTYYLDVQSWNNSQAGDYGLSMVTGTLASYDVTMGAGNLLRPHASWATTPGTGVTVSWAIRASGDDGNGFIAPSAAQVAAIEDIMALFDGISGLNLTQINPGGTSNSATILFGAYSANDGAGAYAYYPGSTASSSNAGDVWLNNNSVSTTSLPLGSFSQFAIMHEAGHTIGLAHPGDYNAGSGGPITYGNDAQSIEDTHQYSLMSYFDESNTTTTSIGSYPDTLMLYDILALHQQYGANMSYNAGNTTYGFNATVGGAYDFTTNTDPFLTIWDGGGTDTLDLSGYAMAQLVDLRAGFFSNIGGYTGNLSIAIGAVIENVVGGSGNDTITGNSADNAITGGSGSDTFVMTLNRAAATITQIAGGYQVVSSLGTDTLMGVEFIQFNDQTLDLSTIAPPPPPPPPSSAPTSGDDVLTGTAQPDDIDLLAGNDQFSAGGGNDTLMGGTGNDTLMGGAQHDLLFGDAGNDVLNGEGGRDTLYGGGGNDTLSGGWFSDRLYGDAGNDLLNGDGGHDRLFGGTGNDTLRGGTGNDTLMGGAQHDLLFGDAGNDVLNGEGGRDTLYGGGGNDSLSGGWFSDWLYSAAGNDLLNGDGGHDRLFGGTGNDTLRGGTGNDTLFGANQDDLLYGDAGNDVLNGEGGRDTLYGGGGNDTLTGGWFSDSFVFADGFGQDVITDFDANNLNERIDLSAVSAITDLNDLISNYMSQVGADVVITVGGDTITVLNVTLAEMSDGNDFIF